MCRYSKMGEGRSESKSGLRVSGTESRRPTSRSSVPRDGHPWRSSLATAPSADRPRATPAGTPRRVRASATEASGQGDIRLGRAPGQTVSADHWSRISRRARPLVWPAACYKECATNNQMTAHVSFPSPFPQSQSWESPANAPVQHCRPVRPARRRGHRPRHRRAYDGTLYLTADFDCLAGSSSSLSGSERVARAATPRWREECMTLNPGE